MDDGLPGYHDMEVGPKGNLWVVYEKGVFKFDGSKCTVYGTEDGLVGCCFTAVTVDLASNLWLSYAGGLSVLPFELISSPVIRLSETCDYNRDGKIDISDVATMIFMAQYESLHGILDHNRDGRYTLADPIVLIGDIRNGTCLTGVGTISTFEDVPQLDVLKDLSPDDIDYVERILSQLELTPAEITEINMLFHGGKEKPGLPTSFSLAQNYPNPFNPLTAINFSILEGTLEHVLLKVYNLRGCLVRTLVDQRKEPGNYSVFWDGTTNDGSRVSSGVYLYRMQAGSFVQTRKMVLMK